MSGEAIATQARASRALLLIQAYAFGFRVEHGTDLSNPELLGMYWWSLSRPGLIDIRVSEGEWPTLRACEDAIIVAHAEELMEE